MSSNRSSLSGVACFCDCCLALHVKWFDAIILESVNNVVLPLFDVHVQPIKNGDCAFLEVVQQNNKIAVVNSLTAIDAREHQIFYKLRRCVVSPRIFIRSQS